MKHILLVEIGTEELPPKMLRKFGELFAKNIEYEFKIINIIYEKIVWFASSRRLAVKVIDIFFNFRIDDEFISNDTSMMKVNTDAAILDQQYLLEKKIPLLLFNIINNALMKFPSSRMMSWGTENIRFVRPVRTVSILLDDKVVLCDVFGVTSSRTIRGHRCMGDKEIFLENAEQYQEVLLKKGFVIVDYEERKNIIRCSIDDIAKKIGGVADYTGNLLEEVTGLLEWPVVLVGSFNEDFLHIPYEILLHVMKVQRKYFPLYDFQGKMLPYFIFVIDIITNDNRRIVRFHEKVLDLSFSDAKFFLNYDSKYLLEEYIFRLHTVLFHKELGSLYDKSLRIKNLSSWVASKINVNVSHVERAAILSKCDLLSHMVFEFPFAQGIIGMYYALRDGESKEIALAQKEQYQPRFSSDSLPSTSISCVISIVDKIDTIIGMFIVGESPKGNRDPMGLRRAAIGVLRIIIEKKIEVDLLSLVKQSLKLYKIFSVDHFIRKIINFFYKRLCILYKKKGHRIDIIQATLSDNLSNLVTFDNRVNAVSSFCSSEESRLLFVMYKRIFNILRNLPEKYLQNEIDCSLLVKEEEIRLAEKVSNVHRELKLLCEMGHYYDSLNLLLSLSMFVDKFFKNVIVLSDNTDLRSNRLVLLNKIWFLLLKIVNTPHHILDLFARMK